MLSLRERRRRATRWFLLRVLVLLLLIGAVTYSAWFAPWDKPVRAVQIMPIP
jgi:cell division septal protein FtsQ